MKEQYNLAAERKSYSDAKAVPLPLPSPLACGMAQKANRIMEGTAVLNMKMVRLGNLLFGMFATKDDDVSCDGNIDSVLNATMIMLEELHKKIDAVITATTDN